MSPFRLAGSLSTVTLALLTLAACGRDSSPTSEVVSGPASRPTSAAAPAVDAAATPTPSARPPASSPAAPTESPAMTATVGKPAPAFRLKDHTGKERTLAEFKGKRVVLWFFPKANTGG